MSVSTRKPEKNPIKPVMIESVKQLEEFCRRHRDGEGVLRIELKNGVRAWTLTIASDGRVFATQFAPKRAQIGFEFGSLAELGEDDSKELVDVVGSTVRMVA